MNIVSFQLQQMTQCVLLFPMYLRQAYVFMTCNQKNTLFWFSFASYFPNWIRLAIFNMPNVSYSGLKFRWLVSFTPWIFQTVEKEAVHLDWLPMHKCHIIVWNPNYGRCETSTKCLFWLFDRFVKRYPPAVYADNSIIYTQHVVVRFVVEVIQ